MREELGGFLVHNFDYIQMAEKTDALAGFLASTSFKRSLAVSSKESIPPGPSAVRADDPGRTNAADGVCTPNGERGRERQVVGNDKRVRRSTGCRPKPLLNERIGLISLV